ncbi:carbohydrate ABC transporter permease [Cohnella herbarum]|nr:carbohydrate ABC transporter permease [Cohnella herbarum]
MTNRNRFWGSHLVPLVVLIVTLAPIFLLFLNAVKPSDEFTANPFGLPSRLTLENISTAWTMGEYGEAYWNSIIVGVCTVLIVCTAGGLCAYALAKLEFRGKSLIMLLLFLVLSVPMGLFLVPLFYAWIKLNLMDTLQGLILIYSAIYLPFNIFLLRTYLIGIPKEISESAKIDGCNELQIFGKIMLPIAKPVFLTVSLLTGLWTWNEFFFANAFIQNEDLKTVATKYLVFVGNYSADWSKISAAGVISILPFIVIYFLLQRNFIEGMAEGSIKG